MTDVIMAIAAICQNEVLEASNFKERVARECAIYYSECIHENMEKGLLDGFRVCIEKRKTKE